MSQDLTQENEKEKGTDSKDGLPQNLSMGQRVWVNVRPLLPLLILVFVFRSTFFEPYKIPSGSMIPTLYIGDFILVNKFTYGFKVPFTEIFDSGPVYFTEKEAPKRGDVIVFKFPKHNPGEPNINYIKRVVGLPGDKVHIQDRILYINDNPVPKSDTISEDILKDLETRYNKDYVQLYIEKLPNKDESETKEHFIMHDLENTFLATWRDGPKTVPADHYFVLGDNRDFSHDSRSWGFVPFKNIKGRAILIWFSFIPWWSEYPVEFHPERIGKSIN